MKFDLTENELFEFTEILSNYFNEEINRESIIEISSNLILLCEIIIDNCN